MNIRKLNMVLVLSMILVLAFGCVSVSAKACKHKNTTTSTKVIKNSTCSSTGKQVTTKKCKSCGKVLSKNNTVIAPKPHTYKATGGNTQATCTKSGGHYEKCTQCGKTQWKTVKPAFGHKWVKSGKKYKCTRCGAKSSTGRPSAS